MTVVSLWNGRPVRPSTEEEGVIVVETAVSPSQPRLNRHNRRIRAVRYIQLGKNCAYMIAHRPL